FRNWKSDLPDRKFHVHRTGEVIEWKRSESNSGRVAPIACTIALATRATANRGGSNGWRRSSISRTADTECLSHTSFVIPSSYSTPVRLGPFVLRHLSTRTPHIDLQGTNRFVVIDRGDVDKSHSFHAYSQRRFIEDPIVQHRFLFPIADIFCFHSGSDGDDSLIGS